MAEIDNIVTNVAPDDNGIAIYRFSKGEMGILFNSSTQLAAEATTEIYGDAGTIHQNYGDAPSTIPPAEGTPLKLFRAGAEDWERFDFPFVPHGCRIHGVARPVVDFIRGEGSAAGDSRRRQGLHRDDPGCLRVGEDWTARASLAPAMTPSVCRGEPVAGP